ncbi:hypothetical protein BUALT_Bualt12G0085100 [Buddleja alternifolia]|uniref:Two-component response regulator n=1 Tax=Buddleja alternifolia TaxID=168488 RepID=A0AAV6X0B6_9LAMI|nr:hypothetical protein BUALT_Bualt12G0085100 [Buddleja alternifolia]
MTVEKIRGENENSDNFPVGLRVLAVDDDPLCLKLLETLLKKCQYHVTITSQARMALKMLRENKDRFDLVISDVHMPDMDGFKLLELVGLEMDLPVIMLSANSDPKNVMKGVTHGACDYLVKPVRLEELRNIWQHVLRKKKPDSKIQNKSTDQVKANLGSGDGHGSPMTGNTDQNGKINRKRKDEDDESEDNGNESEDPGAQKKPRVVWSIELHRKFVGAVNQLGIEKAVPKRILDLMNVEGLTRENKYRLYLKRISQQANMVAALGVKDSHFMRIGSFDGLGDFRTLAGQGRHPNVALSPYTSGMLGRLNSPANVNLLNITPSPLIQPSYAQNSSNSITPLGKMQNPNLFQGIPSSLELDQLQQNKGPTGIVNFNAFDDSRIFTSNFTDPGTTVGSSSNLLNGTPNNPLSDGGFGNQPCNNMASFSSESFNAGINGTIESSKMQPNSLLSSEPFNNSLSDPYLRNNTIDIISSTTMALPIGDSREMQCQEGLVGDVRNMNQQRQNNYEHSSKSGFGSLNPRIPSNGVVGSMNQKMDMFVNGRLGGGGSTLMQHNENQNLLTESRARSNDSLFFEHQKMQGGFVPQSCDSLDDMVNAMIKREQDESIPSCDFGFDDYSFGQGTI